MTAYYIKAEELFDALGEADARTIFDRLGGNRFYVPEFPSDDCLLVIEVGREIADKLAKYVATGVGGMLVEIPNRQKSLASQERSRMIGIVAASGLTERELSVQLGVTPRTIRRMRAHLRQEREAQAAKALAIAG